MKSQYVSALIIILTLAACASKPTPAPVDVPSDRYTVELRPGDLISVKVQGQGTSSFCFGSIEEDGIHAQGGPRVVPLDTIEKLASAPAGCIAKQQRSSGLEAAGEVVGVVIIAPFILTCMAAGGCDMK